jgi:hypothetical protein
MSKAFPNWTDHLLFRPHFYSFGILPGTGLIYLTRANRLRLLFNALFPSRVVFNESSGFSSILSLYGGEGFDQYRVSCIGLGQLIYEYQKCQVVFVSSTCPFIVSTHFDVCGNKRIYEPINLSQLHKMEIHIIIAVVNYIYKARDKTFDLKLSHRCENNSNTLA